MVARMEAIERDLVAYFRSRNEDKNVRNIPMQRVPPGKTKPFVANKTQTHRGGTLRTTTFASRPFIGGTRPHVWSSGPSGTHVDDHDPYWDQCTCPGHHHHPGNHDCPCGPNHMDDQHCWNPSEQEHHHYPDAHHHNEHHHHHQDDTFAGHHQQHHTNDHSAGHHHHTDDHSAGHHHTNDHSTGHHWSHASGHHGNWGNDHSSYDYGHSSGGHGSSHTDYAGAGSFY